MERGWDPQVKKYFRKIMGSVGMGLCWMMACVAGIYFGFATGERTRLATILFFVLMFLALLGLLRYLYNTWKNG